MKSSGILKIGSNIFQIEQEILNDNSIKEAIVGNIIILKKSTLEKYLIKHEYYTTKDDESLYNHLIELRNSGEIVNIQDTLDRIYFQNNKLFKGLKLNTNYFLPILVYDITSKNTATKILKKEGINKKHLEKLKKFNLLYNSNLQEGQSFFIPKWSSGFYTEKIDFGNLDPVEYVKEVKKEILPKKEPRDHVTITFDYENKIGLWGVVNEILNKKGIDNNTFLEGISEFEENTSISRQLLQEAIEDYNLVLRSKDNELWKLEQSKDILIPTNKKYYTDYINKVPTIQIKKQKDISTETESIETVSLGEGRDGLIYKFTKNKEWKWEENDIPNSFNFIEWIDSIEVLSNELKGKVFILDPGHGAVDGGSYPAQIDGNGNKIRTCTRCNI